MKTFILAVMCVVLAWGLSIRKQHLSEVDAKAKTAEISRHTLFIQGILNSELLNELTQKVAILANQIAKQELGLAADFNYNFFSAKLRQRLTLYSLNELDISVSASLIYSVIDKFFINNQADLVLTNVYLEPRLNLFGKYKNELVVMINDSAHELAKLNQELKKQMHAANAIYRLEHGEKLYNIAESELFTYLPHIGLGHLSTTAVRKYIKDDTQFDVFFERINERILREVMSLVAGYVAYKDTKLTFDSLVVNDLTIREYVKEYAIIS